ncbi:unnamed protein product [Ectocarpus sp. 12 AP-2014]
MPHLEATLYLETSGSASESGCLDSVLRYLGSSVSFPQAVSWHTAAVASGATCMRETHNQPTGATCPAATSLSPNAIAVLGAIQPHRYVLSHPRPNFCERGYYSTPPI